MCELAAKIQDAELEVMRVLWEAGEPLPLIEIRRILAERTEWEDPTIKTLLRRLHSKGIVKLERRGVYSAVVTEREYCDWSTNVFLNKLYHGSAKHLVASLFAGGKLDDKDIEELRAMFHVEEPHE